MQVLELLRHARRPEGVEEPGPVDQYGVREIDEKASRAARPGLQQPSRQLDAIAKERLGVSPQVVAGMSSSVSNSNHGADRGSSDRRGTNAQLIQNLKNADVSKPARASATKRDRDREVTVPAHINTSIRLIASPESSASKNVRSLGLIFCCFRSLNI
jgi:hypothetical protein